MVGELLLIARGPLAVDFVDLQRGDFTQHLARHPCPGGDLADLQVRQISHTFDRLPPEHLADEAQDHRVGGAGFIDQEQRGRRP
ncbi:Uncharacterised protein [Mycobacteroides abscessus subsp. abscessus]|nr:Uncharacterised protein [Mycobacteroides abscessus subsp. abscessus]